MNLRKMWKEWKEKRKKRLDEWRVFIPFLMFIRKDNVHCDMKKMIINTLQTGSWIDARK